MSRTVTIPLVGIAGSRGLSVQYRSLVREVVETVVKAKRGVAVGCAMGADAMALRACFTEDWKLRASRLHVFAAFGMSGDGSWRNSAVKLVQKASQHSAKVSWWAGGGANVGLIPRLKNRSAAMVSAVAVSGKGRGLVAFVVGGPGKSPGTWGTIRKAQQKGIPVVVFGCGCTAGDFPQLGEGEWVVAGKGIWARGWRWVPATRVSPSTKGGLQ
jgi:L-asparaginase/Glu-tRNA(Gln) amidotransferase subunit D